MPVKTKVPERFKSMQGGKSEDIDNALEALRSSAVSIAESTDDLESRVAGFTKLSEDFAQFKVAHEEIARDARVAKEMAEAASTMIPGKEQGVNELALRSFPQRYQPDKEEQKRGLDSPLYNLLACTRSELEPLGESTAAAVKAFRQYHDSLAIIDAIMLNADASQRQAYIDAGRWKAPQYARLYEPYKALGDTFKRALYTTGAATGLEWIPTGFASQLIEDIRQEQTLANFFQFVPMPTNPYKHPVRGRSFKSYLVPENTSDTGGPTAIGKRTLETVNMTFTAKMHAAMSLFSTQVEEDSIISVMPEVRAELAYAIAAGLEDAILNGQVSSVFDTPAPGTDSTLAGWDGLRWAGQQTGCNVNMNGGPTADLLSYLTGKQGKYGNRPRFGLWILSYMVYAMCLTLKDAGGNRVVLTRNEMGGPGTFETGELGYMFNRPICVPDDYPQDCDATGVRAGAARSSLLHVDRRWVRIGERRVPMISGSRERYFEYEQTAVKATARYDMQFARTPSATFPIVASGLDLPTA